jgi:hypothetical protein
VLFFFANLNRLMEHSIIDEDIAVEMFGVPQYDYFREYFAAIRHVIKRESPIPTNVRGTLRRQKRWREGWMLGSGGLCGEDEGWRGHHTICSKL